LTAQAAAVGELPSIATAEIRLVNKPSVPLLVLLLCLATTAADARVVRVDVDRRETVLEGKPFGLAGPYEKIVGSVHYAVRPDHPSNRAVVDLDRAPVNAAGEVEFSADVYILRPQDPARGNGSLFLEIPNRGGKGMLSLLDGAEGSLDPTTEAQFGDGFLLRRGFTLAWIGWQFDTREEPGLMRLHAPLAAGVRGLVRSDFVVPEPTRFQPLGHVIVGRIGGTEYAVADPADARNVLTVRDRPNAPRETVPRDRWSFVRDAGRITGIELAEGFQPGRIYELIYAAADPAVVGLGLVAARDLAAYVKHDEHAVAPVERAIVFGISQSGRYLRHFLYQGFNTDEQGRPAFDGVMSHVAGAGRGSFNHRFAQPSRDGQPMEALFYPTDLYPFTDLAYTDPVTGRSEGLLDRAVRDGVAPRIFYTNTSYEYWGRAGSLIHTTPDGRADGALPDNVRIYHLAGLQHFPRPLPPRRLQIPHILARWPMNPNPSAPTMRALLVAMQDWVTGRAAPPASRYPRLDDGTLVPFETVREKFPAIPAVELPRDVHTAYRMDFGPEWRDRGIISEHPPRVGQPFPVFVPDVDADGNDRDGIRIPQIEVPVATYTPWNLRDPSIGAPTERVSFLGSYFPFAATAEARRQAGDPRPSLEERYASFDAYLGRYAAAALRLLDQRFLLPEDLAAVIERGRTEWRYAVEGIDRPLMMTSGDLGRLTAPLPDARIPYGDGAFRFGELRLPDGPGPFPVAIVIHGGCWLAEYDLAHIAKLAEALTTQGLAVWVPEYRRVGDPGGGWPGTFEDVAAGADYLRALAQDHPLDLGRVLAVGHSAGGQLALWLAARARLGPDSPLRGPEPLRLRGVLGLAAAADLAFLYEQQVCGHVVEGLMGGSPAEFPERYAIASPVERVPLDVPQILLNGRYDTRWAPVALRYFEAARAAGAPVRLIEAPESGHFEMIDPDSSTWPLVRDAVLELVGGRSD